jgi:DNA-binding transcriptional regulator LsrR (DeoR family)
MEDQPLASALSRDDILFEVCEQFFAGKSADEIARAVAADKEVPFNRTQVYPALRAAVRRGFLLFNPPADRSLAQRLADRYGARLDQVRVLNVSGPAGLVHVAAAGGDLALTLVKELAQKRKRKQVHIGLGAGYTTMNVARRMGQRLRTEGDCPNLCLHALSSGFSVADPLVAPVASFSFFTEALVEVQYVGLFAEAVVRWENYEQVKQLPGVEESFKRRKEIDVVITSLASADDDGGLLNMFMRNDKAGERELRKAKWVGDVQFRPFSATGPILVDTHIRAVTLFEIADLVEMAKRSDKHVILIAGPARGTRGAKARALRCLLKEPSLRVWTHLVTDVATARAVLDGD